MHNILLLIKKTDYINQILKSKKKKQTIMSNITVKLKRGALREQDNYIFFQYNRVGKEIWLTPEIYKLKRDKEILKRKVIPFFFNFFLHFGKLPKC